MTRPDAKIKKGKAKNREGGGKGPKKAAPGPAGSASKAYEQPPVNCSGHNPQTKKTMRKKEEGKEKGTVKRLGNRKKDEEKAL